jgi:hypothetical protein
MRARCLPNDHYRRMKGMPAGRYETYTSGCLQPKADIRARLLYRGDIEWVSESPSVSYR